MLKTSARQQQLAASASKGVNGGMGGMGGSVERFHFLNAK